MDIYFRRDTLVRHIWLLYDDLLVPDGKGFAMSRESIADAQLSYDMKCDRCGIEADGDVKPISSGAHSGENLKPQPG